MLKVRYDHTLKRLFFLFDMPLSEADAAHPEFAGFLTRFAGRGGRTEYRNGNIVSLSIELDGWRSFIGEVLSEQDAAFQLDVLSQLLESGGMELGDGLQVNFHQNPYDTAGRYWQFILNQGNFTLYFFNRVNWDMAPRNRIVTPFPLHVDIETASTCNMNCPMCYRSGLKHTGQMEPELFRKIVDECAAEGVYSVRLSWRGETLTHPNIRELIEYACRNIPNVSFLTNAFYIDEETAQAFIESGVSYVAVSFDGIGEVYEKVRAPARFDVNRGRLARLKELRGAANSTLPQVRLCTIWPAIKDDPEAYTWAMTPVSDYMVCNPYINFAGPMEIKPDFICQYPWERLVVGYDGETQCCTGWNATDIILGNVRDRSLKEMWLSPSMDNIRETHARGGRLEFESCAACRHGSKGDENVSIDQILERRW
jgi:radical SAM protein with 4Fe4S-binding SPASM domain